MDYKYKALSYIPPKPVNIKQRFGKLTLATCTSTEKTKQTRPITPPTSSKQKTYMYINPSNNDVRISDDSIITDDESDNEPSGSERNKIINNILNSDDKSDEDKVGVMPMNVESIREINRNNYDGDPSQFSERLLLNDSDETNCNAILEKEMGKLEIALNQSTPCQKKTSTPLFSTMSDTMVSRLSFQMDRLGLIELKNLPDEVKIRNSLIERDLVAMKPEPLLDVNPDTSLTNVSILTISSTVSDDSETEENTDDTDEEDADSDVIILSSDEDVRNEGRGSSESEIEKHVSNLSNTTSNTLNTQVKKKLSDFFNNIPSPESPKRISNVNESHEFIPETPEDYEYIPETPENLSLNDNPKPESAPVINTDSSVAKINSQVGVDPNVSNNPDETHVSINISTKIQINIQISELEKTRCDSTEPSEPECELEESPEGKTEEPECEPEESQQENKTNSLKEDEIVHAHVSPEQEPTPYKFVGLNQTDVEIDEEMEFILNELYGKSWQTPQLLEKCVSTKKKAKPIQEKFIEQIDDTDFSLFGKKINDELESTRLPIMSNTKPINMPKALTTKKKIATTKKLTSKKLADSSSDEENKPHFECRKLDFGHVGRPKRQAALKNQQLLKVCDPDTSDSESESTCENGSDSDLDFTINKEDIKNDSDYEQEKENRIGDRRIKKVLGRYEYTRKPSIQNTPPLSYVLPVTHKAGNSKRKLYTPQNFEISLSEETPPPKPNRSSEESLQQISNWIALKNKKIDDLKKSDLFVTPKPVVKAKNELAPKSSDKRGAVPKGDRVYGFIQSLDEKIPKEYCHPDAIKYVDSYVKNKVELAEKLYELYNDKIFNFPQKIDVRWNKKLLTTAGRCLTKQKKGERTCHVELSEKVLTTAGRLRCTLIHELCHAANWIYDGVNGHGLQWQAWASKARKVFPELPTINVCHAYEIEYKYTYMCIQCNVKQQAHSKSIKVDTKRCKFCYGQIEVFLNKKNRDGEIIRTPVRAATGFAKFVQDNYKSHKTDEMKHADVMKILSTKFKELNVNKV